MVGQENKLLGKAIVICSLRCVKRRRINVGWKKVVIKSEDKKIEEQLFAEKDKKIEGQVFAEKDKKIDGQVFAKKDNEEFNKQFDLLDSVFDKNP